MTDAQRENLRALLLAARRKVGWMEKLSLPPEHAGYLVEGIVADLDSALRELGEGADG